MPLDRERGILRAHAFAIVFDRDEFLAAELDCDGNAVRAGINGVLDKFLDDGRGPFNDLAGGDLIGQFRREPVDAVHSQSMRRNAQSMAADRPDIMPRIHQNCAPSPPGRCGSFTFMPYMLVSTVSGMKIVAMTVRTFIT